MLYRWSRGDGGKSDQSGERAAQLGGQWLGRVQRQQEAHLLQESTRGCVRARVRHWVGGRRIRRRKVMFSRKTGMEGPQHACAAKNNEAVAALPAGNVDAVGIAEVTIARNGNVQAEMTSVVEYKLGRLV